MTKPSRMNVSRSERPPGIVAQQTRSPRHWTLVLDSASDLANYRIGMVVCSTGMPPSRVTSISYIFRCISFERCGYIERLGLWVAGIWGRIKVRARWALLLARVWLRLGRHGR